MVTAEHSPRHRHSRRQGGWRRSVVVTVAVIALGGIGLVVAGLSGNGNRAAGSPGAITPAGSGAKRSPPSTATAAVDTSVTISAVGDTDLGNTPSLPPEPSTYLQPVQAALSAPIVFGNLEGTLTSVTSSKCAATSTDCYAFRNPPAYAPILKSAEFTVINSANNHSHDYGAQGLADTTAALQGAGLVQAGLPGQIGVVAVGNTKVAFVDFAPYSNTNDLLDLPAAKVLVQQAKAEADVVVVYMHAGAEGTAADHVTGQEETYVGEDRGNAKVFAHAAIDAGADLVVASGPHVLRGMEEYDGHLIAYSLGNFAGYQNFSTSGTLDLSGILTVTLTRHGALTSGHFTSLLLSSVGQPSVDPSGSAALFVDQLSSEDFGPTAVNVLASGQLSLPGPGPG